MKEFTAKIIDPIGLHARQASIVSSVASKYESDIQIVTDKNGMFGNLKSIMNIMSLAIKKGDTITIKINGQDEQEAYDAIFRVLQEQLII